MVVCQSTVNRPAVNSLSHCGYHWTTIESGRVQHCERNENSPQMTSHALTVVYKGACISLEKVTRRICLMRVIAGQFLQTY